jgi:hypothetical protein
MTLTNHQASSTCIAFIPSFTAMDDIVVEVNYFLHKKGFFWTNIHVLKGILPVEMAKISSTLTYWIRLLLSPHLLHDSGFIGGHKIFRGGFYTLVDTALSAYGYVGAYAVLIAV